MERDNLDQIYPKDGDGKFEGPTEASEREEKEEKETQHDVFEKIFPPPN